MRNTTRILLNQNGYSSPLFIALLFFTMLIIGSSLQSYVHRVHITHNQMEQTRMDTLFQVAQSEVIHMEPLPHDLSDYKVHLPYGTVIIHVMKREQQSIEVQYEITTTNDSYKKVIQMYPTVVQE